MLLVAIQILIAANCTAGNFRIVKMPSPSVSLQSPPFMDLPFGRSHGVMTATSIKHEPTNVNGATKPPTCNHEHLMKNIFTVNSLHNSLNFFAISITSYRAPPMLGPTINPRPYIVSRDAYKSNQKICDHTFKTTTDNLTCSSSCKNLQML